MDFIQALKISTAVFEQYKIDHPKWWKRMDGTPILNDVAVRMAQAFEYANEVVERDLAPVLRAMVPPNHVVTDIEAERKLLPCPFCGSEAKLETQFGRDFWVQCENNHIEAINYDNPQAAEVAWNTRSALGAPQQKPGVSAKISDAEMARIFSDAEYFRDQASVRQSGRPSRNQLDIRCHIVWATARIISERVSPPPPASPVLSDDALDCLRQLVDALDNTYISLWQSTTGWEKQLDQARALLAKVQS